MFYIDKTKTLLHYKRIYEEMNTILPYSMARLPIKLNFLGHLKNAHKQTMRIILD